MNDRVVIHLDSEGVADVRLNRADKMNAIDSAMIEGILAAQDRLRAEPRLRAVVMHGEGRAFCAGLDISRFRSMGEEQCGIREVIQESFKCRGSLQPHKSEIASARSLEIASVKRARSTSNGQERL
jgi:enoyl-CoA hydratase/carnithine racemase